MLIQSVIGSTSSGIVLPGETFSFNGSTIRYQNYSFPFVPSWEYTQYSNGLNNKTLGFNGSEYAFTTSLGTLNTICINIWFYPINNNCIILTENGVPAENSGYYASLLEIDNTSHVRAGGYPAHSTTGPVISPNTVTLDAWNHIYFYHDGSTIHLELNGVEATDITNCTRAPSSEGHFGVGAFSSTNFGSNQRFYGLIDRVWIDDHVSGSNHDSTQDKYNALYLVNLDANNPASYSGSGSTWYDLTGNAHNATLYNNPTFTNSSLNYFSFDSNSFQYASTVNLGSSPQWTLEVWMRVTGSLDGKYLMVLGNEFDGSNVNYSIGCNHFPADGKISVGWFNGSWHYTNGFTPTQNTWYHVVGTYDGEKIRQYVNGTLNSQFLYTGTPATGGETRIARRWDGLPNNNPENFFPGDIGLVGVYEGAMWPGDVLRRYEETQTIYGL